MRPIGYAVVWSQIGAKYLRSLFGRSYGLGTGTNGRSVVQLVGVRTKNASLTQVRR